MGVRVSKVISTPKFLWFHEPPHPAFWNKSPIWTAESKEEHGRKRISQESSPGLSRDQPCSLSSHGLLKELYPPSGQLGQTSALSGTRNLAKTNPAFRCGKQLFFWLPGRQMAAMPFQDPSSERPHLKNHKILLDLISHPEIWRSMSQGYKLTGILTMNSWCD